MKRRILSTCAVLFTGLLTTHSLMADTRIVGGSDADASKWPFIAAIVSAGQTPSEGHFCGGSLIREDVVLTAAHCIDGSSASSMDVWLGVYKRSTAETDGEKRTVSRVVMHSGYNNNTNENDMALLFLSEPSTYPTVPLFTDAIGALQAGDLFSVAGWGTLSSGGSQPDTLQSVDVPHVTNDVCSAALNGGITDDMLCAGLAEGGKDSCQGDSGGPLVFDVNGTIYQTGVVSWGIGCADPEQYGVYARVSHFESWIDSALNPPPPGPTRAINFESGDFSQENFTFSGDLPWEITSAASHSPDFSITSPEALTDSQSSEVNLETEVAAGQMSFWLRVSSEQGWDFLEFAVDDGVVSQWSGDIGWMEFSHPVTEGMHKFTWRYIKDDSESAGDDRAWIDDIATPH